MPSSISLVLDGVRVEYGGVTALESVDLRLEGPGLIQIMGPNGAGKTTLLRVAAGLIEPSSGRILVGVDDSLVDITGRPGAAGRFISLTPQLAPASAAFPLTPRELVGYALALRSRWPRVRIDWGKVEEALENVGLPRESWDKPLSSLSGGQLQRSFIARSLVLDRPVMLLDEPLAAVDPAGRSEIARLLGRLARERLVVVTSHDPTLLLPYTSVIVLLRGRVVAVGPPRDVLEPRILRSVYGDAVVVIGGHAHVSDSHAWGGSSA